MLNHPPACAHPLGCPCSHAGCAAPAAAMGLSRGAAAEPAPGLAQGVNRLNQCMFRGPGPQSGPATQRHPPPAAGPGLAGAPGAGV
ncbi:hypothetical protein HaLaN_19293 [Haematococcus lacustris]|uniref:Uncharacterized protein n=1 Tax=Haematococcus lacustris TaxID=44745 RepID=A0A699ZI33_HAELA|nr:hypothetical protein HaLaN_19293 [Haematococcus lacustris]